MQRIDMSLYQGTVAKKSRFAGVGLHTGKLVELEVLPAPAHTGIVFQRLDVKDSKPILAHPCNVSSTTLCTTLGSQAEGAVSTVEHLMAAFAGLGIDNAFVYINACELPILDGSAAPYVDKLNEAGVQIQSAKRRLYIPRRPLEVRKGDQFMRLEPWESLSHKELQANPRLEFHCSIDFPDSKVIGFQKLHLPFSLRNFMELCEARTFCHMDDVTAMRSQGLAQGGSLDNAVVVSHEKVINLDGLRYQDEFVRHKLLDCIGDLALLGGQLTGVLYLHKAGHELHTQFTRELLKPNACTVYPLVTEGRMNALEGMGLAAMAKKDV